METLLDVWEGALDIDEPLLLSEGVRGLIIRINSISGGLHMDEQFVSQWQQAENFLRAPYFVYNPWVNGTVNFEWLRDHAPTEGVTRMFLDVEVRKDGYSPEVYADELQTCVNLAKEHWQVVIYTGGWFLPIVAHWPTDVPYWWARYPYTFYPSSRQYWTWSQWHEVSGRYGYDPDPTHRCPGTVGLWQCSGDRLILPGCANRAIDLNLFNGNLLALEQWWGAQLPAQTSKLDILWREAGVHGWNLNP